MYNWDMSNVACTQLCTALSCKQWRRLNCWGLTLDNWQATPLNLAPSRIDQPLLNLLDQLSQVLRIRFQDLVEFSKLARSEENLRQAKFEVYFIQAERFEQSLHSYHKNTVTSNMIFINVSVAEFNIPLDIRHNNNNIITGHFLEMSV